MTELSGSASQINLRAVIADDEPLARERLRTFLTMEPGVEVVAECSDGLSTLAAIRAVSPNLVFLDIGMPELDGLGVVQALDDADSPAFVFVTAHSHHAAEAFNVEAVDYVVKPYDRARLQTALRRARHRAQNQAAAQQAGVGGVGMARLNQGAEPLEVIAVRAGETIKLLKSSQIEWIRSADNYVELHSEKRIHLMRSTIAALARQLAPDKFSRISRSTIVNLNQVKEIHSRNHGDFCVVLRQGEKLGGTRNFRKNFKQRLGISLRRQTLVGTPADYQTTSRSDTHAAE